MSGRPAADHSTRGGDATPRGDAVIEGLVLLSHAETDLLALERARAELPMGFPTVAGHSLIGLSASALFALFGARRSRSTTGDRAHSRQRTLGAGLKRSHRLGVPGGLVPGRDQRCRRQHGPSAAHLERRAGIRSNLTSYFMAGGVGNVGQALRYAARMHLGFVTDYEPPRAMPAHGLYHPDLLVTNAGEWESHRQPIGRSRACFSIARTC
jgi:cobaltochelatase CobN